ncbi:hypothetical protein MTR67_052546 [Solanum verrucosum]|uniref:RNase H type-1 domain-containing protein n=1 Tax=Solanum verrucosum TaxID=315347 RepID=A0AAF1A157_SOLVR|nr:hypothetical protein MTR67_052546 [Solanum verrucosum]
MVNITNKTWRVQWELAEQYDELQQALMKIEAIIQHTFREGNKMADYMANLAIDNDEKQIFRSFQQIPPFEKKIINIEKAQIPSLRIRTKRIQNRGINRGVSLHIGDQLQA